MNYLQEFSEGKMFFPVTSTCGLHTGISEMHHLLEISHRRNNIT